MVNYQDKDVRFPPESLCPDCRRAPPEGFSEDMFKLSASLLSKLVNLEKFRREIGDQETEIEELDDSVWDRIEDFDLEKVKQFQIRYYWKSSWTGSNLQWIESDGVFAVTGTTNVERKSGSPFDARLALDFRQLLKRIREGFADEGGSLEAFLFPSGRHKTAGEDWSRAFDYSYGVSPESVGYCVVLVVFAVWVCSVIASRVVVRWRVVQPGDYCCLPLVSLSDTVCGRSCNRQRDEEGKFL